MRTKMINQFDSILVIIKLLNLNWIVTLLRVQSDLQMLYGDALAFFAQPPRCVRCAARKKRLRFLFLKCQDCRDTCQDRLRTNSTRIDRKRLKSLGGVNHFIIIN